MFSILPCSQIYKPVCIAVFWSRLKTTHTLNCFCFGDWGSVLNFQHLFQPPIKKEPHPTFKYPSVWLIPIMFIAMCDIRKDTTKGQTNDTDRTAGEVRRSRRDRVPNNKYAEGIEQLRRTAAGKDYKPRQDKTQHSDESSWSHKRVDEEEVSRAEPSEWLKCMLPDQASTSRLIDVQVVCSRPRPKRKSSEYSETRIQRRAIRRPVNDMEFVDQPRKMMKKGEPVRSCNTNPGGKSVLLEILMKAAIKAAQEPEPTSSNPGIEVQEPTPQPTLKQIVEPNRNTSQPDGRILKVLQFDDKVVFQHSRNGEMEFPMGFQPKKPQVQPAQQESAALVTQLGAVFQSYKRKFNSPPILI